ncbi:MAG: hypothetical protein WCF84_19725 [Anaerolineae bacterium]
MIELATIGKRGLELRGPLMLAAGGYGNELDLDTLEQVHAFVTLPTTLRPHAPERAIPRVNDLHGGVLWNREGANPGLATVLHEQRRAWRRMRIPLILTLASEGVAHWGEIAARVGRVEAISGLELELAEGIDVQAATAQVRAQTDLPLLARIALERPLEAAQGALEGGADALVVGLEPRGVEIGAQWWSGRLAGPFCKPLALRALYDVAEHFPGTPLVGAGGIHTSDDVRAFLEIGARAVQIDTAVWRNPKALDEITNGLK